MIASALTRIGSEVQHLIEPDTGSSDLDEYETDPFHGGEQFVIHTSDEGVRNMYEVVREGDFGPEWMIHIDANDGGRMIFPANNEGAWKRALDKYTSATESESC